MHAADQPAGFGVLYGVLQFPDGPENPASVLVRGTDQ